MNDTTTQSDPKRRRPLSIAILAVVMLFYGLITLVPKVLLLASQEVYDASADLTAVYDAIREAGAELGLADFGSYALNAMRLEKGYHAWGLDFGTEYTVFDVGLEKFVKFDKPDFIGRDAVLRQREREADWSFAGLIVEGAAADPLPSDPIFLGDDWAGYVTSGGTGFRIGRRLALGTVKRGLGAPGTVFEIEILGERRKATVAATPFYDPDNARLRG